MALLKFESLEFEESKQEIIVKLYKIFSFRIPKQDLQKIGPKYKLAKNSISFPSIDQQSADRKFSFLIQKHMPSLKSALNNKPTAYIHKNSRIPLIGSNVFGIVDRNTSIIEIKPITGCNLDCIYCSVDEGKSSKKTHDFVVELDYLLDELKKIIAYKNTDNLEIHIGTQGEPLLYQPILELVKGLKAIKQIKTISINTNGLFLTEESIDKLAKAGLNQINLSINTLDKKKASQLANTPYNVDHIKKIASYAATKARVRIAPVLMDKLNNEDMDELIMFAKSIGAKLGIQNYLYYQKGRKPCEQLPWDTFFETLKELEKKHNVHLILNESDFDIRQTKQLEKPFARNDLIQAEVMCPGRYKNEFIAAAKGRNIIVYSKNDLKPGSVIKVKLKRTKHNIYSGTLA